MDPIVQNDCYFGRPHQNNLQTTVCKEEEVNNAHLQTTVCKEEEVNNAPKHILALVLMREWLPWLNFIDPHT